MKQNGFTLIELVFVLCIVAILATIAFPSYQSHLMKSRRSDAKEALASVQLAQEKWRGNHDSYADNLADLGISPNSAAGYYTIQLTPGSSSGTNYEAIATAVPTGPQASDNCGVLKVTATGFSGDTTCWGLH
ncbi:type IV pilin protein [Legionella sp. km772]|uniref:type IV pilin protein n=1 Tax=Legionella sp. km772 TaxID=2498111 RepID=UPI000F8DDDA5|nr:type IV pilin protein [Legionella sp. km772]RUR06110.1 prepilin-type N-terminal cleavage/methylation domain-containing protein [Legionella sp. km772]